mmetsp:Transcript_33633/g.41470  ORF Transcript_33633/g.41470 Transcript_33633/m.41470 type:complete len:96 (-) Transcript_33633:101-388(-)
MNANQVKNMVTRVPTIRKSVELKRLNASTGSDLRVWFAGLVVLPLLAGSDINGGIAKLGFSTGTTMQSEFKMRPDYVTGTVFAAERRDVPTLRNL